jgi:hypothetical protein
VPYDGDSEKVNLSDGNLSVSIPLLTLSGRAGNDLTIVISLDSQTYHLPTVAFYMGTTATTDLYGLWNQLPNQPMRAPQCRVRFLVFR